MYGTKVKPMMHEHLSNVHEKIHEHDMHGEKMHEKMHEHKLDKKLLKY